MKTWSVGEMIAENPCPEYTAECIERLWDGKESLALLDILRLGISARDRIWVACRPEALTREMQSEWLDTIIERAIRNHAANCGIDAVESWGEDWLSGDDRSEAAAWAAAEAAEAAAGAAVGAAWAVETAAEAAAWAAAGAAEAAAAAAGDAARAARAAAESAAWTVEAAAEAAGAAAEAAEDQLQIQDLIQILEAES